MVERVQAETIPAVDRGAAARSRLAPGHPADCRALVGGTRCERAVIAIDSVRRHLHRRQKQPHVIRNLFQEKHVRYAA